MQFSINFSQIYTKHSSTIAFKGNSGCIMGLVCIQNEIFLEYSKIQKVELPTAYRFSTAERRTRRWADSPSPTCLGLTCRRKIGLK